MLQKKILGFTENFKTLLKEKNLNYKINHLRTEVD